MWSANCLQNVPTLYKLPIYVWKISYEKHDRLTHNLCQILPTRKIAKQTDFKWKQDALGSITGLHF